MSPNTTESFPLFHVQANWKIALKFIENEWIDDLDIAFANWLLEEEISITEAKFCFLCYLMESARQGHLCIKIFEKSIEPNLWHGFSFQDFLIQGYCELKDQNFSHRIIHANNRVYLQRNGYFIRLIREALVKIFSSKTQIPVEEEKFEALIQEKIKCKAILRSQAEAIRSVIENSFTLISGGPGTGKTYCASQLIELLTQSKNVARPLKIFICAPTGKAAAHLKEKIGVQDGIILETKTLHSLLKINSFETSEKIFADLVIVDEASMIDVKLFAIFFNSLSENTKILILGDGNQLPPVEIGTIFSDLKEIGEIYNISHEFTVFKRFENDEMINFAQNVIRDEGEISAGENLKYVLWEKINDELNQSLDKYPVPSEKPINPLSLLSELKKFRILSPFRKNEYGIDKLNHLFVSGMWKRAQKGMWIHLPIIIRKNEKSLGLYNGMTGVISFQVKGHIEEATSMRESERAFFFDENGIRSFRCYELPSWDYAFCLSVHQSQGSEYEEILLLLPETSERFGRELLYTASTRAKKSLTIVTHLTTLYETKKNSSRKINGLLDYFLF